MMENTTPMPTMDRRHALQLTAATLMFAYGRAHGFSLSDITGKDATQSIKSLLERGAVNAVLQLGKADGFLGNEKLRILLPASLQSAEKLLRKLGQSRKIDELVTAMNRGAEGAVPGAKTLLLNAVKSMSIDDAKGILKGGDTSVTTFFANKTREPLALQFLPVVTRATDKVGLAQKYNNFAGKASKMGLLKKEDANIQQYVTGKALDGLYLVIGEQERALRANPSAAKDALLQKILGALIK